MRRKLFGVDGGLEFPRRPWDSRAGVARVVSARLHVKYSGASSLCYSSSGVLTLYVAKLATSKDVNPLYRLEHKSNR